MNKAFLDYYRCPEDYVNFRLSATLPTSPVFFQFNGVTCYGRVAPRAVHNLRAAQTTCNIEDEFSCLLNFDPDEVADNIRLEKYIPKASRAEHSGKRKNPGLARQIYYGLRPFLPVCVRRHLQKLALRGWEKIEFPGWPVDTSVDDLFAELMRTLLLASGTERIPFIWFWPDGAKACFIMTHDVETESGRAFCERLMDINDEYHFKSSFQIVPEKRYLVTEQFINRIIGRGFEANLHGLCHDGRLFEDFEEFLRRADRINRYAASYGAAGFRSPVMYREPGWMQALEFDYDMSFPNTAHLDPQRGGCGTIMPYHLGHMIELPLTMLQDYTMFNILHRHSIDLWRFQAEIVLNSHGLISFIVHPDYVIDEKPQQVYRDLLSHMRTLCNSHGVIHMLPREVSEWWRQRSRMQLECRDGRWIVTGCGSERARVAYAFLRKGEIHFHVEHEPCATEMPHSVVAEQSPESEVVFSLLS